MLKKLKRLLYQYNIDAYLITKNDRFFSEFANPDRLKLVTKFSGSAGFTIILKKKNLIFVDGRYTTQAEKECGAKFDIYDVGKIKPINILKKFSKNLKLGYDPKLLSEKFINSYFDESVQLTPIRKNLIDILLIGKIQKNSKPFYKLSDKISGESVKSKIYKVFLKLKKNKVNNLFISSPANCAWLLNIRGHDQPYSPIPNCNIILDQLRQVYFFSDKEKIKIIKKKINYKKVKYFEFDKFCSVIKSLKGKGFCIDETSCSVFHKNLIQSKFEILQNNDPCESLKAIKNKKEISNMIKSHIDDGIAMTKFLYWMKKNNTNLNLNEIKAKKKLENFRKMRANYLFPSFPTISGSGPNSAIIHYNVNKKTNRKLSKNEVYLCDSGGQYKYGTTDVTRTICFSKTNQNIKNIFTRVLKGHIAVFNTNLNKIKFGSDIDQKARHSLKEVSLDYNHGTGHGVGHFLSVHEGPQAISKYNRIKIQPGMILSNEPGYYKKNDFGIRIENLIYAAKVKSKIRFKNLTLAPIDIDLINLNMLEKNEINYLINYHKEIYNKLGKYLSLKEKKWLLNLVDQFLPF